MEELQRKNRKIVSRTNQPALQATDPIPQMQLSDFETIYGTNPCFPFRLTGIDPFLTSSPFPQLSTLNGGLLGSAPTNLGHSQQQMPTPTEPLLSNGVNIEDFFSIDPSEIDPNESRDF